MVTISLAHESDLADVHRLLDTFKASIGEAAADAGGAARVAAAAARGDIEFFLGRAGAEPVGLVSLTTGFSTYRTSPFGLLEDLFVVPEHRGRGVARMLIEAATDHARRRGCGSLLAGCGPRDLAMWQHLGFRPIGTLVSRDL